jgi:2-oxo-4-hydroxy-4-carboxy-5-ureidoimidazoline decarboxylase
VFEEPTLSSESHSGPAQRPGHTGRPPAPRHPAAPFPVQAARVRDADSGRHHEPALRRFNSAPSEAAEAALLVCCGSHRWAQRLVAHRPYPDLGALLAAADEASYDLSFADLAEALADESSSGLHHSAPAAARTALRAAHAAYESSFGHAFVISLDGHRPEEHVNQVLGAIRTRLAHDPDEERSVAADELRRLARSRIEHLVADHTEPGDPDTDRPDSSGSSGSDSPSVTV